MMLELLLAWSGVVVGTVTVLGLRSRCATLGWTVVASVWVWLLIL